MTGSATRSIVICPCSRLTSGQSGLIGRESVRACNASQSLFCSCLLHACSRACSVHAYYTHLAGLVLFVPATRMQQGLFCSLTSSIKRLTIGLPLQQAHYSCHSSRLFLSSFKYSTVNGFQLISSCFQAYSICSILSAVHIILLLSLMS